MTRLLRKGFSLLVVVCIAAFLTPAEGQTSYNEIPPLGAHENTATLMGAQGDRLLTLHTRVDEVSLLFVATNRNGKLVRNLTQDKVTLLDNHQPPQAIPDFHRETNLPLELGFLIDTSTSVRDRFDFEKNAAIGFFRRTIRAGVDNAFVVGFNRKPQMAQDSTDQIKLLAEGIRRPQDGGVTDLYDAVYQVCKEEFLKQPSERLWRRAVIIVSDGDDNQSEVSWSQAAEMAQQAGVIVYAISTNDSGMTLRGDRILEQFAESTGGRVFFPVNEQAIVWSFVQIEEELRSQYMVSYRPADFKADGRYRSISMSSSHKSLVFRCRRGYFAPQP